MSRLSSWGLAGQARTRPSSSKASRALDEGAKRGGTALSAASVELKVMDVSALDFPDCSFDAAVGTFLFCGLPETGPLPALRELGHVVKPGVRLLNYVRPRVPLGRLSPDFGSPGSSRHSPRASIAKPKRPVTQVSLELIDLRYVVNDLIRLITARVAKPGIGNKLRSLFQCAPDPIEYGRGWRRGGFITLLPDVSPREATEEEALLKRLPN